MASGGELPLSVLRGPTGFIECPCSLCLSRDNTEVEAEKTCFECNYNMCAACTDFPTTFPSMAGHRVIDVSQATGGRSQQGMLPKQRCQEHHGKILDKFCTRHDQLACNLPHKLWRIAIHSNVCHWDQEKQRFPSRPAGHKTLLKDLNAVKSLQKAALKQTDGEEAQTQQIIQDVTQRLHKRVDELAKAESSKAGEKYKRKKDAIRKTIKNLDGYIEAAEASDKILSGFQGDNESKLFIYIKQGQKCERDGKDLLQYMNQTSNPQIPKYTLDGNVERTMAGILPLGRFYQTVTVVGEKAYSATAKTETSVSDISDICDVISD